MSLSSKPGLPTGPSRGQPSEPLTNRTSPAQRLDQNRNPGDHHHTTPSAVHPTDLGSTEVAEKESEWVAEN